MQHLFLAQTSNLKKLKQKKSEEPEENVELNEISPDVIYEETTNENEEWEEEGENLHTERSGSMNVVSVFENAGIHQLSEEEKNEIEVIYQETQENYEEGIKLLQVCSAFEFVCWSLETPKDHLHQKSRTTKLWLNYMDYVNVLKQFIRAERSGDWDLHLYVLERMLNLFAATGHLNYAKCARIHLQQMRNTNDTHPWIYKCFKEKGYHMVRQ